MSTEADFFKALLNADGGSVMSSSSYYTRGFGIEISNVRHWDASKNGSTMRVNPFTYLLHAPEISTDVEANVEKYFSIWNKVYYHFFVQQGHEFSKEEQYSIVLQAYATFGKAALPVLDNFYSDALAWAMNSENEENYVKIVELVKTSQTKARLLDEQLCYALDSCRQFAPIVLKLFPEQTFNIMRGEFVIVRAVSLGLHEFAIALARNGASPWGKFGSDNVYSVVKKQPELIKDNPNLIAQLEAAYNEYCQKIQQEKARYDQQDDKTEENQLFDAILDKDSDKIKEMLTDAKTKLRYFNLFTRTVENARHWNKSTSTVEADVISLLLHSPNLSDSDKEENSSSYADIWCQVYAEFAYLLRNRNTGLQNIHLAFDVYHTFGASDSSIVDIFFSDYKLRALLEEILILGDMQLYAHFLAILKDDENLKMEDNHIELAINLGLEKTAILLAKHKDAQLSYVDNDGNNLLMLAIVAGMSYLALELASLGVSTTQANDDKQTPLLAAEVKMPELKVQLEQLKDRKQYAYIINELGSKLDTILEKLAKLDSIEMRISALESKLK